jgi:hypothetical protein
LNEEGRKIAMKKSFTKKSLAAGTLLATLSLGANATIAINVFNEPPDFPGGVSFSPFAASLGVLPDGVSTVLGSLAGNCQVGDCNNDPNGDTQDSVLFTVGPNARLNSIFITTSVAEAPNGFGASFSLQAAGQPPVSVAFTPYLPLGSTSANQLSSLLGPGVYALSIYGQGASAAGAYDMDYTVELNVSAVPVPAAAWLLGSGVAGLIALNKRRSAKNG